MSKSSLRYNKSQEKSVNHFSVFFWLEVFPPVQCKVRIPQTQNSQVLHCLVAVFYVCVFCVLGRSVITYEWKYQNTPNPHVLKQKAALDQQRGVGVLLPSQTVIQTEMRKDLEMRAPPEYFKTHSLTIWSLLHTYTHTQTRIQSSTIKSIFQECAPI